jgi:flagellar basal-body rod protein FlgB
MSLIDSPMLQVLGQALDIGAFRQKVISSNLANVDTPGYRTRDIDFGRTLAHALAAAVNTDVNAGAAVGFSGAGLPVSLAAHAVKGLMERPDGNNVNADREGLLLADTQLRFTLSAQLERAAFHEMLTAIKEGA